LSSPATLSPACLPACLFVDLPAEKAWEAIINAPEVARGYSQQIVETEHLFKALLEQPAGLARRVLSKAGLNPTQVGGAMIAGQGWSPAAAGRVTHVQCSQ
jgi:ATP-dependent Clp protease ATP-binding subunit ClpA